MKKIIALLLTASLMISIAACSTGTTTSPSSTPASQAGSTAATQENKGTGEGKVINWLCSSAETESWVKGVRALADTYAQTHPGFKLVYENATDQAARSQKIKILASSNALPDWIATDSDPFMQGLAKKGDIVDVKALINELGATDKFYDIAYKFNAFDDGSLYFFSFLSVMEYFWYHPSMFQKAGITEEPKTFEDLTNALKKLKTAGLQPLGFCQSEWYVQRYDAFIPFRLTGNKFIDTLKYNKADMQSDTGMAAANWLKEISPYLMDGWAAMNNSDALEAFLAGNSAIFYYGTWDPTVFTDESGNLKPDLDMFMLPVIGGGKDVNTPTDGWCNSGTGTAFSTKGMDAAGKEFIGYIIDNLPETAVKYGFLPAVKPTDEQIASMPSFYQSALKDVLAVKDFGTCWDINVDPTTYEVLGKETVNLMLGQITPEEFCKLIDDSIDANAETYWNSLKE